MSGHSKWANIKNRKGAQDKKRSEAFTKISKLIMTAIRMGGGNTNAEGNSHLKIAIEKAREANMPKENIERLITRFEERKSNMVSMTFEGFGPNGVPIIADVETDNKNRTLGEIKLIFKENSGIVGESGSVAFMFDRKGEVETESIPEDLQLDLIDAGVQDFDGNTAICEPSDLNNVTKKAEELGLTVVRSELVMKAKAPIMLKSEDDVAKILDLVDALEEQDDVVNVFAGFDYAQTT